MICARCLLRATRQQTKILRREHDLTTRSNKLQRNSYTSSASKSAKAVSVNEATTSAPRQGSGSSRSPPAATSTSAAQPFSTPLTPSPEAAGVSTTPSNLPKDEETGRPIRLIQSCVPAGTPLRGLNFIKGKTDPLAKEDSEYPTWLWDILSSTGSKGEKGDEGQGTGDEFAKSKKQRRIAAKEQRKRALLDPESMAPKVPLYEQSIDLPAGDGTMEGALTAGQARDELTKAMRGKRRSSIKEDNFLRAMR